MAVTFGAIDERGFPPLRPRVVCVSPDSAAKVGWAGNESGAELADGVAVAVVVDGDTVAVVVDGVAVAVAVDGVAVAVAVAEETDAAG